MDTARYQLVGGASFVSAGTVFTLGMISAEAFYPGYSASNDTISALGAAGAPQASQLVFNTTIVFAGLLALLGAYSLHRVYERRLLTGLVALTGVGGLMGVGLFPTQTGLPHVVAALIAFGGMGLSALVVASTVRGPFRYLSAIGGIVELLALGSFVVFLESNPLGIGGLERWVAYLGAFWAIAFGGFLVPRGEERDRDR